MDNPKLEQRMATLEQQLECLEVRYLAHLRIEGPRLGELEIKVQGLEARLKDSDKIETLVFDAYLHSHPHSSGIALKSIEERVDLWLGKNGEGGLVQKNGMKYAERAIHACSMVDALCKENDALAKRVDHLEYCLRHMLDRIHELGTTERIAKTLFAATDKDTQDTLIQLGQFGCKIPGFLQPPQADGKGDNPPKS